MSSSQDHCETGICRSGWWNLGRSQLFDPPCSAAPTMSDHFMWLDSYLNDMDEQADQMKQGLSYSRSDDSSLDDYNQQYSSPADDQHLCVISSNDYTQTFQYVHKSQVTDFNISDWSEYNLSHDSLNTSIFKSVVNDQKNYNNINSHDLYIDQEHFDSKVNELPTGLENNTSSTYQEIIQCLTGPDTTEVTPNNWPKMFVSPSAKQQLNNSTKYTNSMNNFMPAFWDTLMSNDGTDTLESHQFQELVLVEDQKACNYRNPTSEISRDRIAQSSPSDSTLLGTRKRESKTTTTSVEVYKRQRFETPTSLPTFKVRKEKLGDRITALQQLVSPFGKTDTASVLQEAIEYIKFLHDQVLRTPFMQNGSPANQGASKNDGLEGPKHDLKSRGLCLVPISSTFSVANETTADFWTPTFGGKLTFR